MCGISGEINNQIGPTKRINEDVFRFIAHRGPDSYSLQSYFSHGHNITLLHSRLAIIDLSEAGRQPMHDRQSDWIISYNGEIFNYVELRSELTAGGVEFESTCDTEILLKFWARCGIEAVKRFNGMFAFAAFNSRKGELWLVRDRHGVKPLFWGRLMNGGLVFSSSVAEVASAVAAPVDRDYCARGARYKAFELPESGAPFRGVNAVRPGCWVRISIAESGLAVSDGCWYELAQAVAERAAGLEARTDAQLIEECSELLRDAVRIRLRSDVPVAVSLSGGLDSSTVAALAARQVTGLAGFTYGLPTATKSEGPTVAAFAEKVGIHAEYIWPNYGADALDGLLERSLTAQEAPFCGLSVLAQNEVFGAVRKAGFKVLLGGQGGDEAFAGYRKFFVVALRDAINSHDPRLAVHFAWSLGLMLLYEAQQARLYWQGLDRYRSRQTFSFQLLDWPSTSVDLWGRHGITLGERQIADVQRWSIPSLLRYEDRNSMWHGLETRLPFMDYRLMEFALALPARLKIAKGFGKWALRRVDQGLVPDTIRLNRRKRGFDVTQTWIADGLGASLRRHIQDNPAALSVHLKKGISIKRMLTDEHLAADRNLLDEALMLAWLTKPVRVPATAGANA